MALPHAPTLAMVVRVILHHLPLKFQRSRLNGPRLSLLILLAIIQSGVDRIGVRSARLEVMKRLDTALGWSVDHVPSTSAVCRALRKLKPVLLETLLSVAKAEVAKSYGKNLLIHGHRVVAIDGCRINAKRTSVLAGWLGLPTQAGKRKAQQPQALVVVARCIVTGIVLAQEIVSHSGSERDCARRLMSSLSGLGPLLVLLDRGFPARDLIGLMHELRIKFIVRMCGGKRTWRELRDLAVGSAKDVAVPMKIRSGLGRWCTTAMRMILSDQISSGRPKSDRTPERMILVTNLNGRYWNTQRVIAMYHRRWDIETTFREDKRLLGATRSRSTTQDGFRTELLALQIYRIIMALIAAQVVADARRQRWDDPRAIRCTTTQLIAIAWWLAEVAMVNSNKCQEKLAALVAEIIRDSARKRPNRSFKRICKGVEGVWKNKLDKCYR